MEKVRLNHTILKSTNSGASQILTENMIKHDFGFKQYKYGTYTWRKGKVLLVYIREVGKSGSVFTEYCFPYKGSTYDWYHPETVKEFLELKEAYTKWCEENLDE